MWRSVVVSVRVIQPYNSFLKVGILLPEVLSIIQRFKGADIHPSLEEYTKINFECLEQQ